MEWLTHSLYFSVTRWQSLSPRAEVLTCPHPQSLPWPGVEGVWSGSRVSVPLTESRRLEAAGAWHRGLAAAPPADCSRLSPCGCVNSLPSFCRTAACVVIPLLEQWAQLRLLWERLERRPLFLDSPEPRNVWNVRFPVGAALACALPVKILQKAVNCNQIRVLLLDSWCLVL